MHAIHRICAGALVAGVALAIAACSNDTSGSSRSFAHYTSTSSFGTGDSARLTGTLQNEGGCLTVRTPDDQTTVVVLPDSDTTLDADTLTVHGRTFKVGDTVAFGGGGFDTPPDGAVVPKTCTTGSYFIVSSFA